MLWVDLTANKGDVTHFLISTIPGGKTTQTSSLFSPVSTANQLFILNINITYTKLATNNNFTIVKLVSIL
jgi:hypothetical protein